ncbi:MAG: dockerin type I repeat-containing protein [Planctomycetota bacterium]|nr:dockerin type I repeat-containing protein [Planctomycetota bacterium]
MLRRVDHHDILDTTPPQGVARAMFITLALMFSFLACSVTLDAQVNSGSFGGPVIELGDAIIFPGEDHALVPVLITSETEIVSWQMGLEYDELLLSFDEIIFTGTESELLQPILIPSPALPPYSGLQVIYAGGNALPAGTSVLAAYLKLSLVDLDLIPDGGSAGSGVGGIANEGNPVLLTDLSGNAVIPTVIPGTVTAFDFPLFLIESQQGTALDTVLSIPIRAWTDGPVTTFAMGLEYDEWIVCELTIQGSDFDDLTQGEWTVSEQITATGIEITLESTGGPVPALSGETLGFLVIAMPPSAPSSWVIDLVDGASFVDQTPVGNLLDGFITWWDHFIRGDANLDTSIDLSDVETILAGAYRGIPLPCQDAADMNDDGAIDISDAITALQYLFSGSPQPPAPFPDAGPDTTDDPLGCL